jgi:hypothetical protein
MADKDKRDALQLLTDDHRLVEDLFEKFKSASGASAQKKIVRQICEELTIHTMIEEEIFYPAIREAIDEDDIDEAQVEHDSAKTLILSLQQAEPSDDYYEAQVTVLKEQIEHHVYEEERQNGSMFTQVRKADIDLDALGEKMAARKAELKAQADDGRLPSPERVSIRA